MRGPRPSPLGSCRLGALWKRLSCVTTHPPSVWRRHLAYGVALHRIYLMLCECRFQYSRAYSSLRDSRTNISGGFPRIGGDVLVNPKEVIWIVFLLNFQEAIVVVSVSRFDSIDSFVHHEVNIGAA